MAYWGIQRIRNLFIGNGIAVQPSGSCKTITNVTTAGAGTLSGVALVGGIITRDCSGASRTDTTATATQILAALANPQIGTTFGCLIQNTSDAAETITLAGGTDVTTVGTLTIAQNYMREITGIVTATATPAVKLFVGATQAWA